MTAARGSDQFLAAVKIAQQPDPAVVSYGGGFFLGLR